MAHKYVAKQLQSYYVMFYINSAHRCDTELKQYYSKLCNKIHLQSASTGIIYQC